MFCSTSRATYDWSVMVKEATDGARTRPTTAEVPQPSSRTEEVWEITPALARMLSGVEIHSAKRGVTFHTTARRAKKEERSAVLPAPVVPPDLVEDRMPGDWWMVRSLPATASSRVEAEGSMKPRFWDGMS
ncbi:hypothetical protein PspLS_04788 [Pyricularia sp. CBS 133598]|nr:hypothetical protein PspLS_04788 [Pyricularia sp. CBS 133598]